MNPIRQKARRKRKRSAQVPSPSPSSASTKRHALWALVAIALGLGLTWLVATTTLPYALARDWPSSALRLTPNNPIALLTLAERHRATYLALIEQRQRASSAGQANSSNGAAPSQADARDMERADQLRAKIQALAMRTLQNDPLNARAYRLLGEVAREPDKVRTYMAAAMARSRRETGAVFWLLQDSIRQNQPKQVLHYADILLRTEPSLGGYVVSYLGQLIESEDGRQLVAAALREAPAWRGLFFARLPQASRSPTAVLALMLALKETGHATSTDELKPFLSHLFRQKRYSFAYNVWLQLLSRDELSRVRQVNNGDFETPPIDVPYDWRFARTQNAVAQIAADPNREGNKALYASFSGGRASGLNVSQIVMAAPGAYTLEGEMRGQLSAKRGLRWRVHCLGAKRELIGESDMLLTAGAKWKPFRFTIQVPKECPAQKLGLIHDARSASEQLISGTFWFDNLKLVRRAGSDVTPLADR